MPFAGNPTEVFVQGVDEHEPVLGAGAVGVRRGRIRGWLLGSSGNMCLH